VIDDITFRLEQLEKMVLSAHKTSQANHAELMMRMNQDAAQRRELMDQMLDLVRANRHRIEELENWRQELEPLPNGHAKQ
jgi:hypothetical protein